MNVPTERQLAIDNLRLMADKLESGKVTFVTNRIEMEPLERPCCVYKEHANRNAPRKLSYTVEVIIG